MIGRTTEVIDDGAKVTIYATNMVPELVPIPLGVTKEEREIFIERLTEAYEKKRKIKASKEGVLLQDPSMEQTTMTQLLDGFNIFLSYDEEEGNCAWEHNVIYAGQIVPDDLRPGHAERLKRLGWSWNDEFDCWQHF